MIEIQTLKMHKDHEIKVIPNNERKSLFCWKSETPWAQINSVTLIGMIWVTQRIGIDMYIYIYIWRLNWPFEKCSFHYIGAGVDTFVGIDIGVGVFFSHCLRSSVFFFLLFPVMIFDELYWLRNTPRARPEVEKKKHTHTERIEIPFVRFYSSETSFGIGFFSSFFLSWKKKQRAAVRMHRNHYIIMCSPYTTGKKIHRRTKLLFSISMRKWERRM